MLNKIRALLLSPYYMVLMTLLSAAGYYFGGGVLLFVMIALVEIIALSLCLSDDLSAILLPSMLLVVLGTTAIGRLEIVTPYLLWALPIVPAVVLHFVFYGKYKQLRIGLSFYGVVATAIAVLLGGIGNLDATDYSSPTVWYYYLAMSIGLVLLYLLFASDLKREKPYDRMRFFLRVLACVGVLAAAVIAVNFLRWTLGSEETPRVMDYLNGMPYRNVIANLLLLCLPAPFYFAGYTERHPVFQIGAFSVGCLLFGAMLLTAARAAMLFGTLMLLVCLVYYFLARKSWCYKLMNFLIVTSGLCLLAYYFLEPISELILSRLDGGFASTNEARFALLLRSFEDFRDHPFFGIGLCSFENADIYAADGCISWYHLYFPQIWGSLGLVGCFAFLYQLLLRARLALHKPNACTVALSLSYLGIFLYSQLDPGEFVPIPFAMLGILIFVYLERHYEKDLPVYRVKRRR